MRICLYSEKIYEKLLAERGNFEYTLSAPGHLLESLQFVHHNIEVTF
jgi:hypothetical protein